MRLLFLVFLVVALAMAAKKKKKASTSGTFCTAYMKYGSQWYNDWKTRYYKYKLLGHCRARHMGNWKPNYRIKTAVSECPAGYTFWEQKSTCYKEFPRDRRFDQAESQCNQDKGHLFVPNSNNEMQWVTQNIYQRGGWHWLGFFCSTGNSHNVRDWRTVTREDTRKIAQKLNVRSHQPVHHHNSACVMNQAEKHDRNWYRRFHHQNCNEGRAFVCEVPRGGN
jgi:hypothetical protein